MIRECVRLALALTAALLWCALALTVEGRRFEWIPQQHAVTLRAMRDIIP